MATELSVLCVLPTTRPVMARDEFTVGGHGGSYGGGGPGITIGVGGAATGNKKARSNAGFFISKVAQYAFGAVVF